MDKKRDYSLTRYMLIGVLTCILLLSGILAWAIHYDVGFKVHNAIEEALGIEDVGPKDAWVQGAEKPQHKPSQNHMYGNMYRHASPAVQSAWIPFDPRSHDDDFWDIVWPLVLILGVLLVSVTTVIRISMKVFSRVSDQLQHLALGRQKNPIVSVPTEIRPMVQVIENLMGQLHQRLESEQRFTANVAHELRTPIAAMQAQAAVALQSSDASQREHALAQLQIGSQRCARLIDQLLALARLDESSNRLKFANFDVVQSTQLAIADFASQSEHDWALEGVSVPLWVHGDVGYFDILLRNMLDNAQRYSVNPTSTSKEPRSRIWVTLQMQEQQLMLQIHDSGSGLAPEQLEKLGQRFVRLGTSDTVGCGLGWSIALKIAEIHDWNLSAAPSSHLSGLCVTLKMPMAPPENR